ncbi:MAG: NYN domain-containing protein [Akkermansiaceae bacterium]
MDNVLIVDGHSAIFSTPDLAESHMRDGRRARGELVRELTHFQDVSDYHVVVVFDGKGDRLDSELRQEQDILVMYSRVNQTADAVIERIVAQHAEKFNVSVASNDRFVLDTISVFGAFPMSIRRMWELIDAG